MHICTDETSEQPTTKNQRGTERRAVALAARLTWKDQRGATRFASVVARNVSDLGVYVECHSVVSIPLYRLVKFQLADDQSIPSLEVVSVGWKDPDEKHIFHREK